MKRIKLVITLLLFVTNFVFSQNNLPIEELPQNGYYNYVGVQSNLLFRQFLNFSNASVPNNNPFLFSYATNSKRSGRGLIINSGFTFTENKTSDGVVTINNKIRTLAISVGYDKKWYQNKKWIPSWGFDLSTGLDYFKSTNQTFQTLGTITTETEQLNFFIGPSIHAGIMYALGDYVFIGTTSQFNFRIGFLQNKTKVNQTNNFTDSRGIADIGIAAPTAVFLTVRF